MDWKNFEVEVSSIVKQAIKDLHDARPSEHFYTFALYTDTSAMTVAMAANSLEVLELKLQDEDEEDRDESRSYYQWATSEWEYEAWRGDLFKGISKELREASGRDEIAAFRENLYLSMTNVLKELGKERFFDPFVVQNPTLFVTVTDDDTAEVVENNSAKVLSTPAAYAEFVNRYEK